MRSENYASCSHRVGRAISCKIGDTTNVSLRVIVLKHLPRPRDVGAFVFTAAVSARAVGTDFHSVVPETLSRIGNTYGWLWAAGAICRGVR
jgi:hypothetical protein